VQSQLTVYDSSRQDYYYNNNNNIHIYMTRAMINRGALDQPSIAYV